MLRRERRRLGESLQGPGPGERVAEEHVAGDNVIARAMRKLEMSQTEYIFWGLAQIVNDQRKKAVEGARHAIALAFRSACAALRVPPPAFALVDARREIAALEAMRHKVRAVRFHGLSHFLVLVSSTIFWVRFARRHHDDDGGFSDHMHTSSHNLRR